MSAIAGAFVIVVAYLKGGTRKTTTAMMTAFALIREGVNPLDIMVIDADAGTQGVVAWGNRVEGRGDEFPFHVVQWSPSAGLFIGFVKRMIQEKGTQYVIIDLGAEMPDTVGIAATIADLVISPIGVDEAETDRVPATVAMVKGEGNGPTHRFLLTRVPAPRAGQAADTRRRMGEAGFEVFQTEIPHNTTLYARGSYGRLPEDVGAYGDFAKELLQFTKGLTHA